MDAVPNRKSIRLKDYDYSGTGGYFVTLCINHRLCLFGDIAVKENDVGADPCVCPTFCGAGMGGHADPPLRMGTNGSSPVEMKLSPAGKMVERWWNKIPRKFPGIELDAFVIMPNHVHFIVINKIGCPVGADPCVCPDEDGAYAGAHAGAPLLGTIVQWFKIMTTNEYIHGVKEAGWSRFAGKLWQRNYWERVVRGNEWDLIREYIHNNPINWASDRLNPDNCQ